MAQPVYKMIFSSSEICGGKVLVSFEPELSPHRWREDNFAYRLWASQWEKYEYMYIDIIRHIKSCSCYCQSFRCLDDLSEILNCDNCCASSGRVVACISNHCDRLTKCKWLFSLFWLVLIAFCRIHTSEWREMSLPGWASVNPPFCTPLSSQHYRELRLRCQPVMATLPFYYKTPTRR